MLARQLVNLPSLYVRQRREIAELFGFETRNKYSIESEGGQQVAFAAEQQKGALGFLVRQILGHWRTFEISVFDPQRQLVMRAIHPFRFFFQRLEVVLPDGRRVGALQQRFSLFHKKFDVLDAAGRVVMTVASPFWRIWTFVFQKIGREVARIEKRWTGILSEAFTDKDTFRIQFSDPALTADERMLLVAAAVFVDLQYFERKAG